MTASALQVIKKPVGEVLALHGCTESYVVQAIRTPVKSVGAYCWSNIGYGLGSPICARQLSVARQWALMVLQHVVLCT